MKEPKFQKFLERDLLLIIESSMSPETIMNWAKFIVYCKLDDPYLWPAITGKVTERLERFHVDQLLVICVNIAHSLSSEANQFFNMIAAHFSRKMDKSQNSQNDEVMILDEDVIKVCFYILSK